MNYPLWSLPARGLLIASVATIHVFVAHLAVGSGLFLVLAERRARRQQDAALLAYVRQHSRVLFLLSLVLGALTGVGIWFTIGLIHPDATSSLISTFLWVWAIEWTFFLTEIAAALVYVHGWDRLDARTHLAVGWIYAASAWLSLAAIAAILSFMLAPLDWLNTRTLLSAFLNPTYVPTLAMRTLAAVGLAGLYGLFTAARVADETLKEKVARYARRWIIWMAAPMPFAVIAYLAIAFMAGIPLGEPLGGPGAGPGGVVTALLRGSTSGIGATINATRVACLASALTLLLALLATTRRRRRYGRALTWPILVCAFAALASGEWIREDLRKPFVVGGYMFVNGVHASSPPAALNPPAALAADPFALDSLRGTGVLSVARWTRMPAGLTGSERTRAAGAEVFRLLCSQCHTMHGYQAIGPRVAGRGQEELEAMLANLDTWRGRRMPPFAGSPDELTALASYLAEIGRAGARAAGGGGAR